MHIEPVDLAGRRDIAQALQGWAQQGRAAVSLIEKAILRRQKHAILPEPGLQHGKLAGDGLRARLLFGRDTGVDGTAQRNHACCLLVIGPGAAARERDAPCRSGGGRNRRWGIGSKRSNAAAMTCASSRLASWLTRTTSEPQAKGMGIAPRHRRLHKPAITPRTADTAATAHPKSRRHTVPGADPVTASARDQREVLHHCGRSDHPVLWGPAGALLAAAHAPLSIRVRFLDRCLEPELD